MQSSDFSNRCHILFLYLVLYTGCPIYVRENRTISLLLKKEKDGEMGFFWYKSVFIPHFYHLRMFSYTLQI